MPQINHFGIIAPYYDRIFGGDHLQFWKRLLELPVSGKILDLGGGTGRVSQLIRCGTCQIFVVDETFNMLRQVAQKAELYPIGSASENLPFTDESLERVLMVDALHHVADQKKTAKEMWRVLKPGGRILIEEPDIRHFSVKILALMEKLLLMRSHFLTPLKISELFPDASGHCFIDTDQGTAYILIQK